MNETPALLIPARWPARIIVGAAFSAMLWLVVFGKGVTELIWAAALMSSFTIVALRHIRPRRHLVLADGIITVQETGERIPLDDVEAVITRPRMLVREGTPPESADAMLAHRKGELLLPRRIRGRAAWLGALWQRMGRADPVRGLSAGLLAFQQQQAATFGEESVTAARIPSRWPGLAPARRVITDIALILVLGGILMAIAGNAGANLHGKQSGVAGALTGFGGFLLFLTWLIGLGRRSAMKRLAGSGIVVGPDGIALQYGLLNGVLSWEELTDYKYTQSGQAAILRLYVPGSAILLGDFFDRPLAGIHEAIQQYAGPRRQ